jgi:prepilin-type N-terminal cleavage/methylation domain-containing protein
MKTHAKNHQAGFTLIEFIVGLVVAAIMATMVYTYFGNALTQSSVPIERLKKASKLHQVMENIVADYNRLNKINLRYKWRANTAYSVGDFVLPSDSIDNNISKISNNGRYYRCTVAGTSGNALPTWPVTITTPLTGTLTESGTNRPTWEEIGRVWQPSVNYAIGTIVVPIKNNGHFYECTRAGTSGAGPAWPISGTVSEGSSSPQLTWTEAGTILNASHSSIEHMYDMPDTNYGAYLAQSGRYGTNYTIVTTETKFIQFDTTNNQVDAGNSSTSSEKNILKVAIKSNDSAETLTELFTVR